MTALSPNSISIGSSVFAELTGVSANTHRHTDGVKGKTAAVKRQLINRATEKTATKNKRVGNRATQN